MFIGHFGVGFGLKRAAPGLSLGTLFLAVEFLDVLWPTLLLIGAEHVAISPGITTVTPLNFVDYPISHSLLMAFVWAVLFAVAYWAVKRSTTAAVVCGLGVISHWFLDLAMHRPDLPLHLGASPLFGFGMWNSLPATLAAEFITFGVGAAIYLRTTRPTSSIGAIGIWAIILFLAIVYLGNVFGPPPPSAEAIAWVGQSQWLLIAAGFWVDRHRTPAARA